jgi:hypothetical protein
MRRLLEHSPHVAIVIALTLALGGCDDRSSSKGAAEVAEVTGRAASAATPVRSDPAAEGGAGAAETAQSGAATAKTSADANAGRDDAAEARGADLGAGAAPPVQAPPGPTYFAVRDRGVVRLSDGAFTLVEGAPDILLRDMHVAEDGKLYLLAAKGVMRIEDGRAVMVAETAFKTTGSVDAFAVTEDGTVWVVGYKGVSKWDGKAWTTQDKAVLGADVTLLEGVAVDASGRAWVASANRLHTLEGTTWTDADVSALFPRKAFFQMLRRAPDGTVVALASSALVRAQSRTELEVVDLGISGFSSMGSLAFADDGTVALRVRVDAVLVRTPGGATREYALGKDFAGDSIRSVGVDTTARVWVGTDVGVAVLGPGDAKAEWKSGSVLELAGQVEHIVPIGAGPELPAVGPVKTGGLRGRVFVDGKALAGASLELCPSPDMMFETSPCGDAAVRFAGTTDAEGEFVLEGVPIGAYGIAVEVGDKWQLTMSSNFGAKMKAGEIHDVGTINVKVPEGEPEGPPARE